MYFFSPQEILRATPDFLAPPIPPLDIKLIDENEGKALDELSVNSTLVFFDPSAKISSKRRTSSGLKLGHHKNHAQPREIPFGRQHFSHKKRITPLLNRMFSKSKSPKGDGEPSKTASLLNFFKNLNRGSSGHNHIKSKVAKRKTSDDKESGIVTKLVSPHSPKHTKYTKTRYPSKSERTPTKSIDDPLSPYVCLCGRPECRDCYFRLRAVIDTDGTPRNHDDMEDSRDRTLTVKHVMTCPGASVNRNDSYRAMKPFRTQSAPMEYEATKSGRSRSFREKIGLFPDKTPRKWFQYFFEEYIHNRYWEAVRHHSWFYMKWIILSYQLKLTAARLKKTTAQWFRLANSARIFSAWVGTTVT